MSHTILNVNFPKENYLKAKNRKYALAINITENGVNNYQGFNTFYEVETLLNNVKNANIKRKCLFEVIKTDKDVKPYFDIDKSSFTREQYAEFLNEFILYFNRFFNTEITINDILVYNRDDKDDDIIKSSHIIVLNYKINFQVIPNFIKYFETITEYRGLDKAIYTPNRLYNLPYNTKLKYVLQNIENPKYFIPFKEQKDNVKDYFISYTDDIKHKPLKNNGAFKVFEILKKSNLSQMRNAFKKMKNHNTEGTNEVKQDETENEAEEEKTENYNEVNNFNCITETIEHLINYLPKEFYFENKDWVIVTKILKKNGLKESKVKRWLEHSSLITNNTWTYKTNIEWYVNQETNTLWFNIPKFLQIVNSYLHDKPINFYNDLDLVKYIKTKTELEENDIIDILEKNKFVKEYEINKETFNITDIFCYNFKTGFLYDNDTIIGNYYYDICLKKLYQDAKLNNTIEIQDINDMKQIAINFVTNDEVILSCKAKWGSGKTHIIVKNIFEEAQKHNKRVVFITENNALNKKYSEDFNIQTHINNKKINNKNSIACSTESIYKLEITETDILILDEFETILGHYESDTFKGKAFDRFLKLKDAIKSVKKIVILDADLSKDRINLLSQIKNNIKINTYDIKTNNFKDYKFNIYVKEKSFINTIITETLKPLNKIIIPSSSKEFNKAVINEIHNRDKTKTILKIDSDGILLIKNGNHNTNITIENLEQFIITENVDAFFYSPSIKTGISINSTFFNKCYGYAHNKSCNAREFIQMLFRARNLKDKQINIFMTGGFCRIKKFIDTEQMSKYILNPIMLYYSCKIFNGTYDIPNKDEINFIKTDTDYYNLTLINEQEIYNSNSRFNQDCIMRLKYNHDIDLNYIDNDVTIDDVELTDLIIDERLNAFVNCELVDIETFENLTDDDWLKKMKYRFFYDTYFIDGITNQVTYNEDVYKLINNETFYKTYFNKTVFKSYKSLKFTINDNVNKTSLNKTIMDIKEEQNNNIETAKTEMIKLNDIERKVAKQILLIQLLDHLHIDLLQLPFTITNKDLNAKIEKFKFNGFLKTLKNYYTNYELETQFKFNPNDKKYINNTKEIIKSLLTKFDIDMKYLNHKNTTRDFDKLIFCYDKFNSVKKQYNGRLKPICHFKIRAEQVEKTRNTYRYKNEITDTYYKAFKTGNKVYFNTYDIIITNDVKKLKEHVTRQGDLTKISFCSTQADNIIKDLHDKAVLIELNEYFYNKSRPRITSNNTYKLIQNDRINELTKINIDKQKRLIVTEQITQNPLWLEKLNEVKENYEFIWSDDFTDKVNKMLLTNMDYDEDFELLFYQTDKAIKQNEKQKLQEQKDNEYLKKIREIYDALTDKQIQDIEAHILLFVKDAIFLDYNELDRLLHAENKHDVILKLKIK
jgi:hypothetical protein